MEFLKKYSKTRFGSKFEAFFRPSIIKTEFNGSICAYRVFYLPIFRRIKGGGVEPIPPRSLRYRKKRGPERVKSSFWLL